MTNIMGYASTLFVRAMGWRVIPSTGVGRMGWRGEVRRRISSSALAMLCLKCLK